MKVVKPQRSDWSPSYYDKLIDDIIKVMISPCYYDNLIDDIIKVMLSPCYYDKLIDDIIKVMLREKMEVAD